jgi:SAM-dependent methyltransferase
LSSTPDLLRRLEQGRARGYWEENLLDGRHAAEARVLSWLGDPKGRRILDAGSGSARLGSRLAAAGARVTACDLELAALRRAHHSANDLWAVVADLARPPFGAPNQRPGDRPFDDAVIFEVLEHLPETAARVSLFRGIERVVAERLVIAFRLRSEWSRWGSVLRPGSERALPCLDQTVLLRELHLATPYRLRRTEQVRRRNCSLLVAELHRVPQDLPEDNSPEDL